MSCAEVHLQKAVDDRFRFVFMGVSPPRGVCLCVAFDGSLIAVNRGADEMEVMLISEWMRMAGMRRLNEDIKEECSGNVFNR